jgi:glycosyltransferase involved in cell wall biosynthesis
MFPFASRLDVGFILWATEPASECAMSQTEPSLELTILMPCLNEAETLERCITKANRFLSESGVKGEVLIADNGSTDGSQAIAQRLGARVVDVPVRGYGAALGHGIRAAQGRFVIMGDSDDSYNFSNLQPYVDKLREGYQLVMGNRFRGGIAPGAMPFLHRYLGNPVLTFIGRLFFGSPARDFHCGLRGFSRDAILGLNLRTTGMEFASEMVIKASLNKLKVTEIPTTLDKDGRNRPPHLRTWRDGWRHLRFLLMYSPRWLFLYPGLLIFLSGLAGMIWLVPQAQMVGEVVFDVQTLFLSGIAMILGFNVLVFSVLSKHSSAIHGLLPADQRLEKMMKVLTLERLLIIGGIISFIGLAGIVNTVLDWQQQEYILRDYSATMRQLVPASVSLVIGLQIVFGSFLADIIGLSVTHKRGA